MRKKKLINGCLTKNYNLLYKMDTGEVYFSYIGKSKELPTELIIRRDQTVYNCT